ncbi:hypothetical protein GQX74_011231 [Glossina fuscipes]|nr:hypothetical protein GQX74_011231 [Glossina fuscipes]
MDDNRILWLKCSISNLLGVYEPETVNGAVFRHKDDFNTFLESKYTKNKDINKVLVYIWRTFYDKLVEEEITVLEEEEQFRSLKIREIRLKRQNAWTTITMLSFPSSDFRRPRLRTFRVAKKPKIDLKVIYISILYI